MKYFIKITLIKSLSLSLKRKKNLCLISCKSISHLDTMTRIKSAKKIRLLNLLRYKKILTIPSNLSLFCNFYFN